MAASPQNKFFKIKDSNFFHHTGHLLFTLSSKMQSLDENHAISNLTTES
ncbi:hypothetical protein [Acinetobacter sp. 1207_04]